MITLNFFLIFWHGETRLVEVYVVRLLATIAPHEVIRDCRLVVSVAEVAIVAHLTARLLAVGALAAVLHFPSTLVTASAH